MGELIEGHLCGGDRALLTCSHCLDNEIVGKPELMDGLTPDAVRSWFEIVCDDGYADLPEKSPESNRKFDERDRRLAAAAHRQSQAEEATVWLVSDDEDFLSNLVEVVDLVDTVPVHSCDLMYALARCGAIEFAAVESMIEVEGERISLKVMGESKRARKLDRLDRLSSDLIALDWRASR